MSEKFLKIDSDEAFVRDTHNNAVLNTDLTALQKYRAKREIDRQLRQDVENLKDDISEIKQLLQIIANRD